MCKLIEQTVTEARQRFTGTLAKLAADDGDGTVRDRFHIHIADRLSR